MCCAAEADESPAQVIKPHVHFEAPEDSERADDKRNDTETPDMTPNPTVASGMSSVLRSQKTFQIINELDENTEDAMSMLKSNSCAPPLSEDDEKSKEALLNRLEHLVDVAYDILRAEQVLEVLMQVLEDRPDEWEEIVSSELFERFKRKLVYFLEVGRSICSDQDGWFSVFEADGGRQSIKVLMNKERPNEVEYRVAALIPAKLTNVLSVANEIQLLPTWNTLVTGTPKTVGRRTAHYMMINYQMSLLGGMYKFDVLNEVRRFSQIEGGFLAEYIETADEEHPSYTPPPSGFKRPSTMLKNIWVAVGDSHTLLIQYGSLKLPFSLAKWLVQSIGTVAGKFILGGIVKNSMLASQPGNVWEAPREDDNLGLYARLDECCAAKFARERNVQNGLPEDEFEMGRFFERRRLSLRTMSE